MYLLHLAFLADKVIYHCKSIYTNIRGTLQKMVFHGTPRRLA